MKPDVGAVVPAAGQGTRLKRALHKAFVPVAGRPLAAHALRALQRTAAVGWIVVVAHPEDLARMQRLVRQHRLSKVCAVVPGGASRAESVAHGIAALPSEARWVLVHDAARPCVTPAFVASVIRAAKRHRAAACGLPAWLTVKEVDPAHRVRRTLDRTRLWFIQTPQVFRRDDAEAALARVGRARLAKFPDDVSLLEWAGVPVHAVLGSPMNIKVTTPEDGVLAEAILRTR